MWLSLPKSTVVYVTCNYDAGNYENMDAAKLPKLWLAYLSDPSDSGE